MATTTTTAPPPDTFIVPDGDVGSSVATFGSGSAKWDRLNDGIIEATPDDTNGILGLDGDWWRGSFESPDFPGTSTEIRVRVRARSASAPGDFNLLLYSDGTTLDGTRNINPTGSFQTYTEVFSIAKTAAQLTNLEVRVHFLAPSFDDQVSEVEVEIYVPGVSPTTSSSTTTTAPPACLEFDEFSDAAIAAFWNQDKGDNPGATFVESGGQLAFDSGSGAPKILESLWHPARAGGDANITWLNQEIDQLQTFGAACLRDVDVKIPFFTRPSGWGAEGDTIGLIVQETDERYAAICKTIRGGVEQIYAIHSREDKVRRIVFAHDRWPIYFRVKSILGTGSGLGAYTLKTMWSNTAHGWTDLVPRFSQFSAEKYRAAIGNDPMFKVGVFAHHGVAFPPTTTTATQPPGSGHWVQRFGEKYWIGTGGLHTERFTWDEDEQAFVIDINFTDTTKSLGAFNNPADLGWWEHINPSHVRIDWESETQVMDDIGAWQAGATPIGSKADVRRSPVVIKLTIPPGETFSGLFFEDDDLFEFEDFLAVRNVEFFKISTTTTTTAAPTTTTTGPLDGAVLCRNKWNSADHATPCMQLQNNDYRLFHFATDAVCGGRGFGMSSGKLYFEIKAATISTSTLRGGVSTSSWPLTGTRVGGDAESWGYEMVTGRVSHNGSDLHGVPIGPAMSSGDILNVAIDLDAGKLWLGVNNRWVLTGKPHTGENPTYTDTDLATKVIYPAGSISKQNETLELYSQEGLTYEPPPGFDPWCSSEACTTTSITHFTTTSTTAAPTTTSTAPPTTTTTIGPLACRNQWDPTDKTVITLFNNNYGARNTAAGSNQWEGARGFPKEDSDGKLYFEFRIVESLLTLAIGICENTYNLAAPGGPGITSDMWAWYPTHAIKKHNGSSVAEGTVCGIGDIVMVAVDLGVGKLWFGKNGSWFSGDPTLGTLPSYDDSDISDNPMFPFVMIFRLQDEIEMWAQESLHFSPPSGYSPWCSAFAGTTTTSTTTTTTTAAPTTSTVTTTSITHFTTTTSTTADGVWLDKTDDNFWSGDDLSWGAGSWSASGPGPYSLDAIGTWVNNFRPTAIRITATSLGGTQLRDASNNDILNPPSGADLTSEQVHALDWVTESPGNIDLLDFNWNANNISKIEFFLPDSDTTSTTTSVTHFTTTSSSTTTTTAPCYLGTSIQVNDGMVAGDIVSNDHEDWFVFEVKSGETGVYDIETHETGTLADTVMWLYGPDDCEGWAQEYSAPSFQDEDDDGGAGNMSLISINLTTPGLYYVRVHSYDHSTSGTYSINVRSAAAPTTTTTV